MSVAISTALTAQKMQFSCIEGGIDAVDSIAKPWLALCDEAKAEPFYRPDWIRAYVDAFVPHGRLVVATCWLGDRLCAVLPLLAENTSFYGIPARVLRSAAGVHNCRFDAVCSPGAVGQEALRALWSGIRARRDWDYLDLRYIPAGGTADQLIRLAVEDGALAGRDLEWQSLWWSSTTPEGWLDATRPKFRANLRRTRKQIEQLGPVRLNRVTTDVAQARRFYELEASGWKGAENSAISCNSETIRFYDAVVAAAARDGYLALDFFEAGDRAVSAHLGLQYAGRYYSAKAAYDESLSRFGPGQLIVYEIVRQSQELGIDTFDFAGPSMADERRWTSTSIDILRAQVFSATASGRLLHAMRFKARPAIKNALALVRRKKTEEVAGE